MSRERLTPKQRLFAEHYVGTLNGRRAAELAGYKGNPNTLAAIAYENLRKPHIAAEVNRLFKERPRMTEDEMIRRLEDQASASVADLFKPGTFEVDPDRVQKFGHLIESLWTTKQGVRLTLHNPQKALELLGKTRALFVERTLVEMIDEMEIVDDEEADNPPPAPES